MKRQLIIGSLLGVALGGVLTSGIAHGVFTDGQSAMPAPVGSQLDLGVEQEATTFDGQPPLRPGSDRVGLPPAPTPSAEIPIALDAQVDGDSPTV